MRANWTETTLGAVAEVDMGQSPPGSTYNTEGLGMPFMQGSAEFGDHSPRPVKYCSAPLKVAEIGDLLLSVRAPVGDSNIADQRIAIGRGLAAIRGNEHAITTFLRLLIQSNTQQLLATSGTGMFSSITGKNLRELSLALPPLSEQKRIVDVITSVDAYIEALQHQAGKARTARNAVLHDLLTAGGDNWTETTLGEVAEIQQGQNLAISTLTTGDYPVYGANGIVGHFDRWNFDQEVVALGCRGSCGTVHIVTEKAWLANNVMAVWPKDISQIVVVFIALVLETADLRSSGVISGQVQPQITRISLSPLVINVPSLSEQEEIVEIVLAMDDVIRSTEQAISEAQMLRSGLLSDLLSGDHEIPETYDHLLGAA